MICSPSGRRQLSCPPVATTSRTSPSRSSSSIDPGRAFEDQRGAESNLLRAPFNAIRDENPKVIFLTADLAAYTDLSRLPTERPRQFLDVGMAEQNLMCIAGGLAKTGLLPIATTFAVYASRRAFDQMVICMGLGAGQLAERIGALQ